MNRVSNSLLVFCCLILVGCSEKQADIEKQNQYEKDELSFSYPGNWDVTEDSVTDGWRIIFIESPGDALMSIEVYANDESFELQEFVELSIDELRSAMPDMLNMSETIAINEIETNLTNSVLNGYRYEFSLSIIGIEVPHVNDNFMFTYKDKTAYISSQVATEDLEKVKNGFQLVLETFDLEG